MTGFRTLDDIGDVTGKRVLVRVDLNVPMFEGAVSDATRIQAAMPTIRELSDKGAIVLLLAHFGRPKGAKNPTQSLSLVMGGVERLQFGLHGAARIGRQTARDALGRAMRAVRR